MFKLIYLTLVVMVLLPGVLAAVVCVQDAHTTKQFQRSEQSRTTNPVFVMRKNITIGVGPLGVTYYPHDWAAILLLLGFLLCVVGMTFLFFVRPW